MEYVPIYTQRGFLHCLFGYTVFSGPQQRISERESAFFVSVQIFEQFENR